MTSDFLSGQARRGTQALEIPTSALAVPLRYTRQVFVYDLRRHEMDSPPPPHGAPLLAEIFIMTLLYLILIIKID